MSQLRNIPFSVASRHFYDDPALIDDKHGLLAPAQWPAPQGWSKRTIGLYESLRPDATMLPEQGWKIHISTTVQHAAAVAPVVWEYCIGHGIAFKFLRSIDAILQNNSKYWPRTASGKFCAIYPRDEQFESAVIDLDRLLAGQPGPFILGDIRYARGPVFARYGAFVHLTCLNEQGEQVPAIRDPSGRLVPDHRDTVVNIPGFVSVPDFLAPYLDPSTQLDSLPFDISHRLHVSNGGGIYKARRKDDGAELVLREARPFAGMDSNLQDAVSRLRNEQAMLARLDGLDCVPRLHGRHQFWEHEFLSTEYVEGRTLLMEIIHRYPYAHPRTTPEEIARYLDWARQTITRIEAAVEAIHRRGVQIVDLHPANIIVRPQGEIVIIDFECARMRGADTPAGLGALGFAPGARGGDDGDRLSLSRILMMILVPIVPMLSLNETHVDTLLSVARALFTLDDRLMKILTPRHRDGEPRPPRADEPVPIDAASWPSLRASLTEAILSRATADRKDVIFRCDALQFTYGAASLAYGAAGIVYAIHSTGGAVPENIVDHTYRLALGGAGCTGLGLYDGLHGVAFVLHSLDMRPQAEKALAAALVRPLPRSHALFGGTAGIILNLLHLADAWGSEACRERALALASATLGAFADEAKAPALPSGLMHGGSGLALAFLRVYEKTGAGEYLRAARALIAREIALGILLPDGAFHLVKTPKYLIYLDEGSAGLALVLERFLKHEDDAEFRKVLFHIRRGCSIPFVMQPGLFQGRAGLIATLAESDAAEDRANALAQAGRLSWHATHHLGHVAFPGNGLTKFCDDLASGSAGVLIALHSLYDRSRAALPLLD